MRRLNGGAVRPTLFQQPVTPDMDFRSNYPQSAFADGSDEEDEHGDIQEIVVNAVQAIHTRWDEARKTHLAESARAWDRYQNKWDFSRKAEWQNQKAMPEVTMTVERLTAAMSRLLAMSRKWFQPTSTRPIKQKFLNFVRDWVMLQLNHPNIKFLKLLKQAIKIGLLSHIMPTLVSYETNGIANPDQIKPAEGPSIPGSIEAMIEGLPTNPLYSPGGKDDSTAGVGAIEHFLRIENCNPQNVILDPSGRKTPSWQQGRGFIVERTLSKAELVYEAEACKYIEESVQAILDGTAVDSELLMKEAEQKDMPVTSLDDDVIIWECWFDHLIDEDGQEAIPMRNFFMVIGNKENVLIPPTPNPFWHKKLPLVVAGMLDVPFSVYHNSPISISLDAVELWVDTVNMVADHYQQRLIGIKEINMENLHTDEKIENARKLYPGKALMKNTSEPLISQALTEPADPSLMQYLQLIQGEIGKGTAARDAQSSPLPRGKMTSNEMTSRKADAGELLDTFFENIQDDWIVPVVRMAFLNSLQFTAQDVWEDFIEANQEKYTDIKEELELLKKMTPRQRYEFLGKDIDFECKVFSAIFDRQQEVEKSVFFMGMAGRVPAAMAHINWPYLLGNIVENLGWDSEKVIFKNPIVSYDVLFKTGAPGGAEGQQKQGSDGGEAVPTQSQGEGQMVNQSAGMSGGAGEQDASFGQMAASS